MAKSQPKQATSKPVATLTLKPEAFVQTITSFVGPNKIGWSGSDHVGLGLKLLNRLRNEEDESVEIDEKKIDPFLLALRPTEELQRRVMNQTLKKLGYQLDSGTEEIFMLLFNMARFGKWLSETNNPDTSKPFITVEKAKSKKKSKFDSLFSGGSVAPSPAGDESPEQEQEEEEEP